MYEETSFPSKNWYRLKVDRYKKVRLKPNFMKQQWNYRDNYYTSDKPTLVDCYTMK